MTLRIGPDKIKPHHLSEDALPLAAWKIATDAERGKLIMTARAHLVRGVADKDVDQVAGAEIFARA